MNPVDQGLANKRKAYRCKRCFKVDRRHRVVEHILKYHIPFDRLPYCCSLCNFRCQDMKELLEHVVKYKRHGEEVVKLGGAVNHGLYMHMSSNPQFVGDQDMEPLTDTEEAMLRPIGDEDIYQEPSNNYNTVEQTLPNWARGAVTTGTYMALSGRPSISVPVSAHACSLVASRQDNPPVASLATHTVASSRNFEPLYEPSVGSQSLSPKLQAPHYIPTPIQSQSQQEPTAARNTELTTIGFQDLLATPLLDEAPTSENPLEAMLEPSTQDREDETQQEKGTNQDRQPEDKSEGFIDAIRQSTLLIVEAINKNTESISQQTKVLLEAMSQWEAEKEKKTSEDNRKRTNEENKKTEEYKKKTDKENEKPKFFHNKKPRRF